MLDTFTFLLTDIEASTRLWEQAAAAMRRAMARHDALIAHCAAQFAGRIKGERGEGDSRFIVFTSPQDAVQAAVAIQELFRAESWRTPRPIQIRIGIHTGKAQVRENDFYGSDVNRCARIRALAHGGQTLVSQATRDLVASDLPPRLVLRDLGLHRLKDLQRPERIYQLDPAHTPSHFPPLTSLNTLPNNLPVELTSFIGREREIQKLEYQLETAHLVTLVGAGGCGKTRLALHVSAQILENFPDGVWFIELAALSDPTQVPQAVASVLGVREAPGISLTKLVVDYTSPRAALIILDNCEHLIPACAQLATDLSRACPRLKILATSRQPLGIAGEMAFRVPSLALPDPTHTRSQETLLQSESARLFVERALAARSDWQITNPAAVAQICQQLDGIPLALELAAPRVKGMTVEQIAERLTDRFDILTGGSRTALPRQQTMRALIDWSYDLLSNPERIFLQRFSVFSGGASLQAIERVCANPPGESFDWFETLSQLIDKSLILMDEQNGQARYRMLETIRQYAREKFESTDETNQVRERHRDYFLALAEEGEPHLRDAQQLDWLNRLELERDNLIAALEWSQTKGDTASAMRFGGALWLFWNVRGYWTEGRVRLANILAMPGSTLPTQARAKTLVGIAFLTLLQGDLASARARLEDSLAISRAMNLQREIANALYGLGSIARLQGDYAQADTLFGEGLALFRALQDRWGEANALLSLGLLNVYRDKLVQAQPLFETSLSAFREIGDSRNAAKILGNMGLIAYYRGAYAAARSLYEQALVICREFRDELVIVGLADNLGYVALHQQDYVQAHTFFKESLTLLAKIKSKRVLADVLYGIAALAAAENAPARAARLFGAGEALYAALGAQVQVANRAEYDQGVAAARSQIESAAFDQLCDEGRRMTLEQAIDYALESPSN